MHTSRSRWIVRRAVPAVAGCALLLVVLVKDFGIYHRNAIDGPGFVVLFRVRGECFGWWNPYGGNLIVSYSDVHDDNGREPLVTAGIGRNMFLVFGSSPID